MSKDDFFRDETARTQRLRTENRRRGRLKRKTTWAAIVLLLLIGLVAAAPTVVSRSPVARNVIASQLNQYGFTGGIEQISIGWVTPLRLGGLELVGNTAGSRLTVASVDTEVSLLKALRGLTDLGEITVRGVTAEVSVSKGTSSVEQDLQSLTQSDSSSTPAEESEPGAALVGRINVRDVAVKINDTDHQLTWGIDQANAEIDLGADQYDVTFSTVLTDPQGGSGELEGRAQYAPAKTAYQLSLLMQRLPLSVASLAKVRLGEAGASIPEQISGDMSGSVTVAGGGDATLNVSATPVELRGFVAADPSLGQRVWRNGLTVISGAASIDAGRIVGRNLQLTTDFGKASFDGAFNTSLSLSGESSPAAWLQALDGAAGATVDLVAFESAFPGLIPLRPETAIVSGGLTAEITSNLEAGSIRRSHWSLQTQTIRATAAGKPIAIEPINLLAALRVDNQSLTADAIRLKSSFANATVEGDLSRGRIKGDVQFSRLASMVQPLLDMPELSLAGQATTEISWAAEANHQWKLSGKADATELAITLPGGTQFQQPQLSSEVIAKGSWKDGQLQELSSMIASLNCDEVEANVELVSPVANPTTTTALPLRIASRGRLESLAKVVGPWLPADLQQMEGGYSATAVALTALDQGEVTTAKLQLEQPRVAYGETVYLQPQLIVDFDGRYAWPSNSLDLKRMTVAGDAFSAALQGGYDAGGMDIQCAWRGKLERLQASMRPAASAGNGFANLSAPAINATPANFRTPSDAPESSYRYFGDCEGRFTLVMPGDLTTLSLNGQTTANQLKIVTAAAQPAAASAPAPEPLWVEKLVNIDHAVKYDLTEGTIDAEKVQVASDWFATSLTAKVLWNEAVGDARVRGTARIKMPEVATKLSQMLGLTVKLEGVHETPIELTATRKGSEPLKLLANANLGWEAGEVAGIRFGQTSIPVTMNESLVSVKPATIPVVQGRLQVAGDLHYAASPMWLEVKPGVIAEDLTLTQELTNQWMQYIAPMLANATRVQGTFGVELTEANINLEDTMASRVRGALRIKGVNLDSGPMTNQIIGSIKQIQQIARGLSADPAADQTVRLVTFPTQSVEFEFAGGVVTHQRMVMEIDRATILTGGQVNVDGRVNLVAQIPLDPSWLGSDLKALAGKTVTLPIGGTVSRPALDGNAIRNLVTEMGAKALQGTAENYLEKQLGKGLDKLFGR